MPQRSSWLAVSSNADQSAFAQPQIGLLRGVAILPRASCASTEVGLEEQVEQQYQQYG